MKPNVWLMILLTVVLSTLFGCALTAMYGEEIVKDSIIKDQYTFKVYVGGLATPETADRRAVNEIETYLKSTQYKTYEIKDRVYNMIPSYYRYYVKFFN